MSPARRLYTGGRLHYQNRVTSFPGRAMTTTHDDDLVTVFGASGFIGRHVVRALTARGWRVRVACRRPDLAFHLQPLGRVGQVHAVQANLRYPASVTAALRDAKAVVNLVGLLSESGRQTFDAVHAFGARTIARECAKAGITHFVQMSALGADKLSLSGYARTKAQAEASVLDAIPGAVILRPSVVFGVEDFFFNRFAGMARMLPALPLVGADTKFQPVFVGDVAEAVARALDGAATPGTTYELGGPDVATLRDLVEFICRETHRRPFLVPVPFGISRAMASATELASKLSLGLFPAMLTTTPDQVALLRSDNVVSAEATTQRRTLQGLGIAPESYGAIVPGYLWRYRRTGQFEGQRLA
jgi:uncharacterized protein YbjT (DUF2867 family)